MYNLVTRKEKLTFQDDMTTGINNHTRHLDLSNAWNGNGEIVISWQKWDKREEADALCSQLHEKIPSVTRESYCRHCKFVIKPEPLHPQHYKILKTVRKFMIANNLFFGERNLSDFLKERIKNQWSSANECKKLKRLLPHKLSVNDIQADICLRGDLQDALEFAVAYREEGNRNDTFSWFRTAADILKYSDQSETNLVDLLDKYFPPGFCSSVSKRSRDLDFLVSHHQSREYALTRSDIVKACMAFNEESCEFIASSNYLQKVNLRWNSATTTEDISYLTDALSLNTSLKELVIDGFFIGDEGAEEIVDALTNNQNMQLRVLSVRDCLLRDGGADRLLELMKLRKDLRVFVNETWIGLRRLPDNSPNSNVISEERSQQFTELNAGRPEPSATVQRLFDRLRVGSSYFGGDPRQFPGPWQSRNARYL